jgi:predicted nucleotide-binding protein
MKERFQGNGHEQLIEALGRQEFALGRPEIVADFIASGELVEFQSGEKLIAAGDSGNDVYLIVAGTISVVVKGNEVRTLTACDHVGEMAAIEPAQPRSASVIAQGTVVAQKIPGATFVRICDKFPTMWKPIARELAHRLYDRNRLMKEPNELPRLFIISSVEALDVAREIASGLQHEVLPTVWTEGVFWASGYPLEALERAVGQSDFAVAVAQFEDMVQSRGQIHPALRDNVLFELGMFMGHLGRRRTILVHPRLPDLRLPSDLHGITPASYIVGKLEDLPARIGPVCTEIRRIIRTHGVRTHKG